AGSAAAWQDAAVAVITGRCFSYSGKRCGMVVATGDESGPRRTAQSGRVEVVVLQPLGGQLLQCRGRDAAAKGAVLTESGVVNQYEKDIGCSRRRLDHFRKLRGVRFKISATHLAWKVKVGAR